ncbi:MAG: ABC transporter ATP-binding protein [Caldilineaceae bacterium]
MSDVVIRVENLSKEYRLGTIGGGTVREDLARWWAKRRGKADPTLKIGETDHGNRNGEQIFALQDVSFEVNQGEVLGIIGRNGAGKSTLLKILSRVTSPTSGNVKVKGRIASLLEVGTGFHPDLTGRENVYLNGAILGMRRYEIDHKFDEIVDFSGVEQFIDTPVKRYSSGMKVRLAFAVAAHLEPEILLVDEVLAVGDAEFQKKCLGKMGDVASEGRTVIFISHNMSSVAQLCNDCIWLERGQVVNRGIPKDVITSYLLADEPTQLSNGVITPEMHAHEPDGLRFTHVELVDSCNQPVINLFFGEPLHIRCSFDLPHPLHDLRIGIALYKIDNTLICAVHHTDDIKQDLLQLAPGKYVADIVVDISLMPGAYNFDIFAKPKSGYWTKGKSADWVPRAISFNVEEIRRSGAYTLPTSGTILPPSEWEVMSISS